MSLRVRLALFSSLVTFMAIALLVLFSGLALERSLLRDLDEELRVRANVILSDFLQDGAITQETEVTFPRADGGGEQCKPDRDFHFFDADDWCPLRIC